jgi:hypothetical protein
MFGDGAARSLQLENNMIAKINPSTSRKRHMRFVLPYSTSLEFFMRELDAPAHPMCNVQSVLQSVLQSVFAVVSLHRAVDPGVQS